MDGYLPGNRIKLLKNGAEYFPELLGAIARAEREIFLESYLFELDVIGEAVCEALMKAVARGVEVKVQLDGFGARKFPDAWKVRLADAGVWLLFFRPEVKALSFNRQRLRRLHRKLVVVDGMLAFAGGINVLSDYTGQPGPEPRYDYMVEVRGPVVATMHEAADRLWRHTAWVQVEPDWARTSRDKPAYEEAGGALARFDIRDNLRNRHSIEHEYLEAIERATDEILIACAYFLPGYRFRHALIDAAKRGVKVVLLLQGTLDHALLQYASRAFFRQFIEAGIEIHEYVSGYMHAKVAVIDRAWATVGSSNIDPFSLLLAREGNVFVRDEAFADALAQDVRNTMENSARRVILPALLRGPAGWRIKPWISYGIVRFLMAVSGYGGERYLK
ncbi:cardiolipin synthase ClsB [Silvimonas amylolytica]|uniref:Cardiolipin synthase B n=1 Tax=Silvimonas amylolytica TaxID=449663 RepID=A0ABQ2PG71_9NEIS|nr:cardiolipin synthase ClsB [Silvimonas amylolytica]GGP24234.1 cardiolipin synthase B [Silvimonas amylolytica]